MDGFQGCKVELPIIAGDFSFIIWRILSKKDTMSNQEAKTEKRSAALSSVL
jgi:hypothetical protein